LTQVYVTHLAFELGTNIYLVFDWIGRLCLVGDDPLNVGHALVENLLKSLGVLKLLLDLGDDGLGKLLLLPLLDLALVADPRVENGLGLVSDGGLLLELERLGLELGGLLLWLLVTVPPTSPSQSIVVSYLGNLEEGLGDVNDTAEVLDALDARLDGRGVVGTGSVQDAGDLVGLLLRVIAPGRTSVLCDSPEDGQERQGNNGLLVDNVELIADSGNTETSSGGEHSSLGEGAVSGHGNRVHQRLGLLLGVLLGHIGLVAGLRGDGWEATERERWAETGGACCV
jgi:hypothetical protein